MAPNIVLFVTDDHARWSLGCYGCPEPVTPNIDALAQAGRVFDGAHTPVPVCSPARACVLTGLTASQHGLHDYIDGQPQHFDRDWMAGSATLPELLQAQGYRTGLIGKWHLGRDTQPQHGFEYWHTLAGDYPVDAAGPARHSLQGALHTRSGPKADVITDHALEFLNDPDERPFFLVIGHVSTHSPWEGHPERLVSRFRDSDFAHIPKGETFPFGKQALESADLIDRSHEHEAQTQYHASVASIDEGVGRVMAALSATGRGDDTLTIYTSDHGLNCGHHGVWGKGNGTLPLNMLDESIQVPLVMHHPAGIDGGQRVSGFVDHLDLFQTVLAAGGAAAPADVAYAGRSLLDIGQGRDWQVCEYGPVRMIRTQRYKLVMRGGYGPDQLFDLLDDPRETQDRLSDPALAEIAADLRSRLDAYFAIHSSPPILRAAHGWA